MARMSGRDCVRALEASGFKIRTRMGGITTLIREGQGKMVVVPEVDELTPELLQAILRSAGLSLTELYAGLAGTHLRIRSRGSMDDDPPSSV